MFTHNVRHELRLLSRNQWFVSLSIVMCLLCLYAGYNGLQQFNSRQVDQRDAILDQRAKEDAVREVAEALERGEDHPNYYRMSPMNVAIATGKLATMPTTVMSKLAIGQSDLYAHQVKIASNEDLATLSFNEMSNPVQLLFGNFDLVFVLAYLVPLIIIAFTYNLKSQELESGRFRLLASNPLRINVWLFQRFTIRYFSLSLILVVSLVATVLWVKIPFSSNLLLFFLLALAYLAFWFALSFLVNILGHSSAKNAVSLLSLWIVLVLIVPAVINQAANVFYPMPSRIALLNEIRETKSELTKEQDKVLDEYLRNHPELIREKEGNTYAYWQSYFASQEMMEKELTPLTNSFEAQLEKQQAWVDSWRFVSPVVLFQDAATDVAGTSSKNYSLFKSEVKAFSLSWRAHFMPFIFDNSMLKLSDLEELPEFKFRSTTSPSVYINMAALLVIGFVFIARGLVIERRRPVMEVV